jgi:hypothetical protein
MDGPVEQEGPCAWQPLTPSGVAEFARATTGRLLVVQLLFALLAAGSIIWAIGQAWFPPIRQAIEQLPPAGEIRKGQLDWRGSSPVRLAENRYLALIVDLEHRGDMRTTAHVNVEFGRGGVEVFSLLGFVRFAYPTRSIIWFNHTVLAPWWGAWSPEILALIALGVTAGLLICWAALAALYSPIPWLLAFFADRQLNWGGAWRLAGAALLPGCLLMSLAIFLYSVGTIDLVRLGAATAVHFALAWPYLVISHLWLPRVSGARTKGNPFAPPPAEKK